MEVLKVSSFRNMFAAKMYLSNRPSKIDFLNNFLVTELTVNQFKEAENHQRFENATSLKGQRLIRPSIQRI